MSRDRWPLSRELRHPFPTKENAVSWSEVQRKIVAPPAVRKLGDRVHSVIVVAVDFVELTFDTPAGARAERLRDVALLAGSLHSTLLEDPTNTRQCRDLRVEVCGNVGQPFLLPLPEQNILSMGPQQLLAGCSEFPDVVAHWVSKNLEFWMDPL